MRASTHSLFLLLPLAACVSTSTAEPELKEEPLRTQGPFDPGQPEALVPCEEGYARVVDPISFTMPAPEGLGREHLGRPVNANFDLIEGTSGASLFPDAAVITTPVNKMDHAYWTSEGKNGNSARLSIWFVSFEKSEAEAFRYAAYTANQVRNSYEVDTTQTVARRPPVNGVYYVSRLTDGASYSMILRGHASQFHWGIAAQIPLLGGIGVGLGQFGESQGLEITHVGRGLAPKDGDAIFATDPSAITRNYEATGDSAVPITVEYKSIPNLCVQTEDGVPWLRPIPVDVKFDQLRVFRKGGATWALTPVCDVDGREQILFNDTIDGWDAPRPVDDNTISDGTAGPGGNYTYGRYQLNWQERFMLLPHQTLRCRLSGVVSGGGGHELPSAGFEITLDPHGFNEGVDAQVGDFDAAVDYYLDYRVEFPTVAGLSQYPTRL